MTCGNTPFAFNIAIAPRISTEAAITKTSFFTVSLGILKRTTNASAIKP